VTVVVVLRGTFRADGCSGYVFCSQVDLWSVFRGILVNFAQRRMLEKSRFKYRDLAYSISNLVAGFPVLFPWPLPLPLP